MTTHEPQSGTTHGPRRFAWHALGFAVAQAGLLAFVFGLFYTPSRSNMIFPVTHIKHRLAEEIPSPRVILTGGSAMLYSFDSDAFEDELGVPAVNMGIIGHLKLGFILNEAVGVAREGDLVVLAIEYPLFQAVAIDSTPMTLVQMVEQRPASWAYVPTDMYKGILDHGVVQHVQTAARQTFRGESNRTWASDRCNEYGELVFHLDEPQKPDALDQNTVLETYDPEMLDTTMGMVDDAVRRISAKGAVPVLSLQPMARSHYEARTETLERFVSRMRDRIGAPILGTPADMVFDDPQFFDMGAHLRGDGPAERSRRVARQIRAWVESGGAWDGLSEAGP